MTDSRYLKHNCSFCSKPHKEVGHSWQAHLLSVLIKKVRCCIILCILQDFNQDFTSTLLIFVCLFCFANQSKGLLAYFGNFRLLAEFSTPFVNQR